MKNKMELKLSATSTNESFARATVGAFAAQLDPTVEQMFDIKTAVSEAVTNAIVHGYKQDENEYFIVKCEVEDGELTVSIEDNGCGMSNLAECQRDYFTTASEDERSGLGFTIMRSLMDDVAVSTATGEGTIVILKKRIR